MANKSTVKVKSPPDQKFLINPSSQSIALFAVGQRAALQSVQRRLRPDEMLLVREVYDSILEICFLHCKFTCRTRGEESTFVEHFQQIVPVGAYNKLGTQNWKGSAGTKL